jgi:hypothetical protein
MGVGWKVVLSLVDEKRKKRVLICTFFLRCIIFWTASLLNPKINQKVVGQHTLFDKNENNNTKKQTPMSFYLYVNMNILILYSLNKHWLYYFSAMHVNTCKGRVYKCSKDGSNWRLVRVSDMCQCPTPERHWHLRLHTITSIFSNY